MFMMFSYDFVVIPDGPRSGPIRNLEVLARDSGFTLARAPE
jgi:hypothetical protein